MHSIDDQTAMVMAGVPSSDMSFYHRIRFSVGDPAAWIGWNRGGRNGSRLILRDIEMERARKTVKVGSIACPADFAPDSGLSPDRAIATAQATAECLVREGFTVALVHRDLPMLFADCMRERGIELICDRDFGVADRRAKDEDEIEALSRAQAATESAMEMACRTIGGADAAGDGELITGGEPLTSERVRSLIDMHLIGLGFAPRPAIVAGGVEGADCHQLGSGPLRTSEPVIVDIFPRDTRSLYNGDCTRTVVHGDIPDDVVAMHAAVVSAKRAGIEATKAGVTAESVHQATIEAIRSGGFGIGLPGPDDAPSGRMVHGTGHGIGLDVHEGTLLDLAPSGASPKLLAGEALTIEPGVYDPRSGGVRIEDLVIVRDEGCDNLNTLHEGLDWR